MSISRSPQYSSPVTSAVQTSQGSKISKGSQKGSQYRGVSIRTYVPLVVLNKRGAFVVLNANGEDKTPKAITEKKECFPIEEGKQNALDFILGKTGSRIVLHSEESDTKASSSTRLGSVTQSLMATGTVMESVLVTDSRLLARSKDETEEEEERSVLEFGFPTTPDGEWKPLSAVIITLHETPTIFILDRPNDTVQKDSEEARVVQEDNEYYEYVTVGKGRFRKVNASEAQTMDLIKKTRTTIAEAARKRNKSTFVSEWEVYDTYKELEYESEMEFGTGEERVMKSPKGKKLETQASISIIGNEALEPDEQFKILERSEAFLDACAKMERLLASNVYRIEQKTFRGLMQPDPFRLEVEFKYNLKLLWSFTSDYVNGRTVTGMCWNYVNTDLIAVGYGKFYYQDRMNGLVCCWTIKNPTQPERKYLFDCPVTSIDFSKDRPNLLACGFYDGSVIVLNISSREKTIISRSNRETSPSYEPIWQIFWFYGDDYHRYEQQLMTCCQDGRICRYRREKTLNCFPMMWVSRMEGRVKGIDQLRKCKASDIPVSRHPAALVVTRHPENSLIYYVGTDEGCIHKCSTNYLHHHLDIFLAHNGPVYCMQFSPFCSKIFLTSGADWCTRIWTEGVGQPLITLQTSMEVVQSVSWSPIHATIIASVSGNTINFWDIRRKIATPTSTTTTTGKKNLLVQFTSSGLNLVVGDIDGAVHVYGLEDMPFSPFYQEIVLVQAIKKALLTRPDLLKALKKVGKPFF